jgi:hypothetical protein
VFTIEIESTARLCEQKNNELNKLTDKNRFLNDSILSYTSNIKDKEMKIEKLLSDINDGNNR